MLCVEVMDGGRLDTDEFTFSAEEKNDIIILAYIV